MSRNNNDIPILTETSAEEMLQTWNDISRPLMNRDGSYDKYPNGGHDIKNNPVLIKAIEQIRDAYLKVFIEGIENVMKLKSGERTEKENEADTENYYYDLIQITHDGLEKLQEHNFGYSDAEVKKVLAESGRDRVRDSKLERCDAMNLMGSVIKKCIDAFDITFGKGVSVPDTPFSVPEAHGLHRSSPRTGVLLKSNVVLAAGAGSEVIKDT